MYLQNNVKNYQQLTSSEYKYTISIVFAKDLSFGVSTVLTNTCDELILNTVPSFINFGN